MLFLLLACTDYELTEAGDVTGTLECPDETPRPEAVVGDDTCLFDYEPGDFSPEVEWRWEQAVASAGYDDVMVTPVVGDVDQDGTPEIVFTSYTSDTYSSAGALTILDGRSGQEEGSFLHFGGHPPNGSGGVALGDLDADGVPEIVLVGSEGIVLAAHADGSLVWASEATGHHSVYSYPVIADLDADGTAEVVVGRAIFDHTGALEAAGDGGTGNAYGVSVVADLDMDGIQEVVTCSDAYAPDGTTIWQSGLDDGWAAVADLDLDGQGEVACVTDGLVHALDSDGSTLWGYKEVPGGGGGPPTIADFDGDGWPEIGVAGHSGYAVYETDGTKLWEVETTDESSSRTGSSVFDFEGDGASEVVYADEVTLWVYDGATGAPLLAEDGHSSWTLFEYPVIADVDADGEAEIVLASNDSLADGWQGITVVGDAGGTWAPASAAWNQHAYHITNVDADTLAIPASPQMNWELGHNSFRAGGLEDLLGNPSPNLGVSIVGLCWDCGEDTVEVMVQVSNEGLDAVDGAIAVGLYAAAEGEDGELLAVIEVDGVLPAASSQTQSAFLDRSALESAGGIRAVADDGDAHPECEEGDNEDWTESLDCGIYASSE